MVIYTSREDVVSLRGPYQELHYDQWHNTSHQGSCPEERLGENLFIQQLTFRIRTVKRAVEWATVFTKRLSYIRHTKPCCST